MFVMLARFAALVVSSALLFFAPVVHADPPARDAAAAQAAGPHKIVLSNGLEVFVVPDHRVPSAVVAVRYRVGRRDDPADRRGMAELFKPLLERPSTRHLREFARADVFQVLGVPGGMPASVFVTDDLTLVTSQVAPHLVELALFLEADRMGFLSDNITSDMVDFVRAGVENAAANDDRNVIVHILAKIQREVFGPTHPYGRLGSDLPLTLGGLTAREVLERKRDAYGPGNATLVVMGDVSLGDVERHLKRYFEPLLPTTRLPAFPRGAASLASEKRMTIEANVPQYQVLLAWPTAPFYSDDDIALDVVARVLRERMHRKLGLEMKATVFTGARQASSDLGSYLYVTAAPANGHDVPEVQRLMEEEIRLLSTNGPTPSETSNGGSEFATSLALGHVRLKDRAHHLGDCYIALGDASFYNRYIAGYLTISAAEVQKAAARYLHPTRRIVANIVPTKDAPPVGRVVGEKP